jgi:hypothetical protein
MTDMNLQRWSASVASRRAHQAVVTIEDVDTSRTPWPVAMGRQFPGGGLLQIDLSHGVGYGSIVPRVGDRWWVNRAHGGHWVLDHLEFPVVASLMLDLGTVIDDVTPDLSYETTRMVLGADISVLAPIEPEVGKVMRLIMEQDEIGGRLVTLDLLYRANWSPDTTSQMVNTITFLWDGGSWIQTGSSAGV